jgi:type IX secretion system PorP/SprF family membrane protein
VKIWKRVILLFFIIYLHFGGEFNLFAQDPQFTQFYAAPLYMNPAFAGANVCSRFSASYKDQWPSIPKSYVTYVVSFDHSLPHYNSGFGIMMVNDRAGNGVLRTIAGSILYSYELQLSRKWLLRAGFKVTESVRSINYGGQIFGDQIANSGAPTSELLSSNSKAYFDVSCGVIVYSRKSWYGFSAHHLNKPDQSFLLEKSQLPVNYSFHCGYKLPVKSSFNSKGVAKEYFSPCLNYRNQGRFNQFDIGVYYTRNSFILGLWYRGLPILKSYNPGYINHDAIAPLCGFSKKRFYIGYSYDITISKLSENTSGGAHEISLSYQFCDYRKQKGKKRKLRLLLPCPKF